MPEADFSNRHAWASAGVVAREGGVHRIWECEDCPAWTAEELEPVSELPWDETWLSDR